jgi:hypothetical protein
LTNSDVKNFTDWVSTEILRDEQKNYHLYNYWIKCRKEVGDSETLVCYFSACRFVLSNAITFELHSDYFSISDYCIDVLVFINENFGTLPLYYRYPTYELIGRTYMGKGELGNVIKYSEEGITKIKKCVALDGTNDPFKEIKSLAKGELTMLESLYLLNFSMYNLVSAQQNLKYFEFALMNVGKLMFSLSHRGQSVDEYKSSRDIIANHLERSGNYTIDEINNILFYGNRYGK